MSTYPTVGIVAHERVAGAYSLSDVRSAMRMMALDVALQQHWPSGALFTTYTVSGERSWPRINKRGALVDELRTRHNSIVRTAVFGFDYDRPKVDGKKNPWKSQEEVAEVLGQLRGAPPPTAAYVTRHGLRLIYVLEQPIDPWEGEGYYAAMLQVFERLGVPMDPACQNWDRLFRLPFVTLEDGVQTWDSPVIANGLLLRGGTLSLEGIRPIAIVREAPGTGILRGDMPDPKEAAALIEYVDRSGTPTLTAWGKMAKGRLRGRDYYEAIFDGADLPCPDGHDNGVLAAVSSVIGLTAEEPGTTPRHIFGLLHGCVSRLPPSKKHGVTREQSLWDKVQRIWSIERAKIDSAAKVVEVTRSGIVEGYVAMLAEHGMSIEALRTDTLVSEEDWVLRHSIATDGKLHYLLDRNGRFRSLASSHATLISDIHTSGMASFYPMTQELQNGGVRSRSPQQILDLCGVTYHRRDGVIGAIHTSLEYRRGGERVLRIPLYRLNDELLESAEPSPLIDQWLREAFGAHYPRVVEWISHSLDLNRGICAMSIVGPPRTGKSLLAWVLALCLHRPVKCDVQVFGKFNAGLAESPIVHIDEGLESVAGSGRTVDETFRVMTTGGQMALEAKGLPVFYANIYPRLLLTANADNVIESIAGRRDLSRDARAALEERLLMVSTRAEGRQFFEGLGHDGVTRGFFGDQMAAPRHFLWLYLNRREPQGQRLLVEGEVGTELFHELTYASPSAQIVLRALFDILLMKAVPPGVELDGRHAYVSSSAIASHVDYNFRGPSISARTVASVLKETGLGQRRVRAASGSTMWELCVDDIILLGEKVGRDMQVLRQRVTPLMKNGPVFK